MYSIYGNKGVHGYLEGQGFRSVKSLLIVACVYFPFLHFSNRPL